MKHIRDPIYGYISVSESELEVIGAPEVQRLRRINQLGLSSVVYPGATHTRFEHSLGVCNLAGEMADSLNLPEREVEAYRFAGLLHDIGHAPFSHAIEPVMENELGFSHESQSCNLVDKLDNEGYIPDSVDTDLIKDAIQGDSAYDIVSGEVDVDRMDYLRRDAFETGLEHGNIDTRTILQFAEIRNDNVVFSHKSIQALEGLFTARFHMSKSVYAHHTSKICEKMLQRAVEYFISETSYTASDIITWDDYKLHTRLTDGDGIHNELFMKISNRDLYKRALLIGEDEIRRERLKQLSNIESLSKYENQIAESIGVSPEKVIIDLPKIPNNEHSDVGIIWNDTVRPLMDISEMPKTITESEWRKVKLGVYSPKGIKNKVKKEATKLLL